LGPKEGNEELMVDSREIVFLFLIIQDFPDLIFILYYFGDLISS